MIKVWDVRNWRCLQTLPDKEVYSPDDTVAALAVNAACGHVVTGNSRLKAWTLRDCTGGSLLGHAAPASQVCFTKSTHVFAAFGEASDSVCRREAVSLVVCDALTR